MMLNVAPQWFDLLEELQMRFEDGVLKVSEAFKDRGDTLQLIQAHHNMFVVVLVLQTLQ